MGKKNSEVTKLDASTNVGSANGKVRSQQKTPTAVEIQSWLVHYLADILEVEPDEIDVTITFDRYGLDSAAVVGLTGDLGNWLGRELDSTLPYNFPSIEALARHLTAE